jgi:hypothetical protein
MRALEKADNTRQAEKGRPECNNANSTYEGKKSHIVLSIISSSLSGRKQRQWLGFPQLSEEQESAPGQEKYDMIH